MPKHFGNPGLVNKDHPRAQTQGKMRRFDLWLWGTASIAALLVVLGTVIGAGLYLQLPRVYYYAPNECAYVIANEDGWQVKKDCSYANNHWTRSANFFVPRP